MDMTPINQTESAHVSRDRSTHIVGEGIRLKLLFGVVLAVIAVQIWLIFQKAINWDEFLHYGQIYALEDGRFGKALQSLHVRLFGWTTLVSQDVITQIQAARLIMLACVYLTAAGVVLLARKLVNVQTAMICGLVYLTAGYVFTNGFTYRPDPVAAAALMGALCLLALGTINWRRMILAGILVGFAGVMTIKSIFYAPCFAAVAFLWWGESKASKSNVIMQSTAIVVVALLSFGLILGIHSAFSAIRHGTGKYRQSLHGHFPAFL